MAQMVKNLSAMWETQVQSLGWEYPLEKGMATRSSVLVLRIPWTEEPGRLQSLGPQRVRHDWVSNTHTHTHTFVLLQIERTHIFVLFQIIFHYAFSCWSCVRLFATPWTIAHHCGLLCPWAFPGKNTVVGCHLLLQFFIIDYYKILSIVPCAIQ